MPPCFDVYVWVPSPYPTAALSRFIDRYVDSAHPGDPRFAPFIRTFVAQNPAAGDNEALADLRRDDSARSAFSLYLKAKHHHEAIITVTEEAALVLGLGLDDPYGLPETTAEASSLMSGLMVELQAVAAIGGTELPPPQSAGEWADDALVQLRDGSL